MKKVFFALILSLVGIALVGCGSDPADLDFNEELDVCITPQCQDADGVHETEAEATILLSCIWYCTEFEGKPNMVVNRVFQSVEDSDCFVQVYEAVFESHSCDLL